METLGIVDEDENQAKGSAALEGLERSCGSCAVCCKVLQVPEFVRAKGDWCPKARPGSPEGACTIYPDRPTGCRGFACLWLLGAGQMPDRPDRLGVMFAAMGDKAPSGKGPKVYAYEFRDGRLLAPRAKRFVQFLLAAGTPVTAVRIVRGELEKVDLDPDPRLGSRFALADSPANRDPAK